MGKKIKIDLPEGNQVVTTVQHQKIPPPKKNEGPSIVWFILAAYLMMILIASFRDSDSSLPPEEGYFNPTAPTPAIPTYPPTPCPYPAPGCY